MSGLAAVQDPAPFGVHGTLAVEDAVTTLAWRPDGSALYVGNAAGGLRCLDAHGATRFAWQAHQGGVTRIALQPGDPEVLATAGGDGRVVLWNANSGEQTAVLASENGWVEHLAWTPNGEVLAAAARRTISLWRGTESLGVWYDARRQVLAMSWAPDGRRLATAANKGLYLWHLDYAGEDGAQPMQLLSFPGAPIALAWQRDSRALAVGTQDGYLQVWQPARPDRGGSQGKARQLTMRGYPGTVDCLAWHPRRALIATAGGHDVVLWEMPAAGQNARGRPLRHHRETVTALNWSGDGEYLASADRGGRLCIWNLDGDAVFSLRAGNEVTALTWRSDGSALAVGDIDGGISLLHRDPSTNPTTTAPID